MKNTTDWTPEERAARIAELTGEVEHLTANPPLNPKFDLTWHCKSNG